MKYILFIAVILSTIIALPAQAGPLRDLFSHRDKGDEADEDNDSSSSVDASAVFKDAAVKRDVAYGTDAKQRLDVYIPPHAAHAPIVVMVHGGGWRIGDKNSSGVVKNKGAHFLSRGFIFISVGNRLLPDADPVAQADDVAAAVAFTQKHAAEWGGDPARLILMGHSAGAHLVALLAANPARVMSDGGASWRGTVMLDSAALDVPRLMREKHYRLHDKAFGKDPAFWAKASPSDQLSAQGTPMLLICSTQRDNSCPQAHAFDARAKELGLQSSVQEEDLSHKEINVTLGLPGAYTDAVDRFIDSVR